MNYVIPVRALGTAGETRQQLEQLRALFHENSDDMVIVRGR